MKNSIKLILLFLLCFTLDLTLIVPGAGETAAPRFVLLTVIFSGLKWNEVTGALTGFATGALYCALFGLPVGVFPLVFGFSGFLAGKMSPFISETPRLIHFFFAFIILMAANILHSFLISLMFGPFLSLRIISALIGSTVFAFCVYPLLNLFRTERRRRSA